MLNQNNYTIMAVDSQIQVAETKAGHQATSGRRATFDHRTILRDPLCH